MTRSPAPVDDLSARSDGRSVGRSMGSEVLDALFEGCQIVGFDWTYKYLNDAIVSQSRQSREELLGRTMMECYPGIEATPMFAELSRCMRDRTPGRFEDAFHFPDGSRLVFALRFVPVPEGVCILSQDLTAARHPLAAIVNDSDDAIFGQTLDGVVTSWNQAAERIFGYSAAEIVGQSVAMLHPQGVDEDAAWRARLRSGERLEHVETVRRTKSGELLEVCVTVSPVRDGAGEVVGASKILRDITPARRAAEALFRAKERLEAAHHELESFSYSVAHDLRAPLRSLDGFSRALLEDQHARLDAEGRLHLAYVRESAQLMGRLIDDILSLSRVGRGEITREAVDLSAVAETVVDRLQRDTPQRRVEVAIEPGIVAHGDARLLAILMQNLLANAWKFTARRELAHVGFGAETIDGELVLFVRDDGAGFDPAFAGKLFGAFQRLHSSDEFEGTGIGLATVKRVVARHGGRIWAEGSVDGGATFRFTLRDPLEGHDAATRPRGPRGATTGDDLPAGAAPPSARV